MQQKLSQKEINEMAMNCIDELGHNAPFLTKKKFYRFKNWYDEQEPVRLLSSMRTSRTMHSVSSSTLAFNGVAAAWTDRKARQSRALAKSKTLTDLIQAEGGDDPNAATLNFVEQTAQEVAHEQIDFYGEKLVNTLVHYAKVEIAKANVASELGIWSAIEGFFFFFGTKIGLLVALPFAIVAFVFVVLAFFLSGVGVIATFGCFKDLNGVCVAAFVLITLTWVVTFHTIIMIIDLESGGLGLVFAILQSVLVSTYIQASLHFLDDTTNWFDLPVFLRWLFETIVDLVASDLKGRDLSELARIMMEDVPDGDEKDEDEKKEGDGGDHDKADQIDAMLKMKSLPIEDPDSEKSDKPRRLSIVEKTQLKHRKRLESMADKFTGSTTSEIELQPMDVEDVKISVTETPSPI